MSHLISTSDRAQLYSLLSTLTVDTRPLWGKMKPQQMVEHLVDAVEYSDGKEVTGLEFSKEKAAGLKQIYIYTDKQIPKNLVLGELPPDRNPDLKAAIDHLMRELADFDKYFKDPATTSIHPGYDAMNGEEWVIWHSKHFSHHFKQFGLLPE